jgi:proteasome lid subunit RPN8/RPN11
MAQKAAPDAGQVRADEYPWRRLPPVQGRRLPDFQVVARRSVLNDIYRHGHDSPDVEVCGILVGNVYRDEAGPFLYVEASIRGEHAGSQDAQVTFTTETWTHVQEEMEKHHAGERVLGWYHTHPGFGIFLSGMDLFIQENFFSLPWQVAFVYDPLSGEEGLFVWRQGAPVGEAFLVEEDAVSVKRQGAVGRGGEAGSLAVPAERLGALEKQQKGLLVGVAALAVLVLIWFTTWVSLGRSSGDDAAREWDQHFLLELGQLRTESKDLRGEVVRLRTESGDLRGEVMGLRLEVAQLRAECDRRLPPLAEAVAGPPLSPADKLLLALDGSPGPPRLLFTWIKQVLAPPPGEAKGRGSKWKRPRPQVPGQYDQKAARSAGND